MIQLLYVISAAAIVATLWLVVSAVRAGRAAQKKQQQLTWIYEEARRALNMVNSDNEDRVVTGLQMLCALNEPESRLAALHRIAELTKSDNPTVAETAETTLDLILPTVGNPSESRPSIEVFASGDKSRSQK